MNVKSKDPAGSRCDDIRAEHPLRIHAAREMNSSRQARMELGPAERAEAIDRCIL
jgi:hypothetical protein